MTDKKINTKILLNHLEDIQKRLVSNYNDNAPFEQLEEDRFAVLNAIDLINRLQADNKSFKIANEAMYSVNKKQETEIEKLQKLVEQTDTNCRRAINLIGGYEKQLEIAKVEARQKLAERLKFEFSDYVIYARAYIHHIIDERLKEKE